MGHGRFCGERAFGDPGGLSLLMGLIDRDETFRDAEDVVRYPGLSGRV